jgi:hypothetical protein
MVVVTQTESEARATQERRRGLARFLPERKRGAERTIFLTRRYVFKLPGRWTVRHWRWWWASLLRGLLSNMQERTFALEGWPQLCPIGFALPGGWLIVMPRARPLTDLEWNTFDYRAFVTRGDAYVDENFENHAGGWTQGDLGQPLSRIIIGNGEPDAGLVPAEYKRDSFGVLKGRVVAVDYG